MKHCPRCKTDLPRSCFYTNPSRYDGVAHYCKPCSRKYAKEHNHFYTDKRRITMLIWKRSKSGKESQSRANKQPKAKARNAIARVKWAKTEKGRAVAIRINNRRRSREMLSKISLTADEWLEILNSQTNKCAVCDISFDKIKPTRDHIIPLFLGGGLTKSNIQALCMSCNSKKGILVSQKGKLVTSNQMHISL